MSKGINGDVAIKLVMINDDDDNGGDDNDDDGCVSQ